MTQRTLTPFKGSLLAPELDYILLDGSGSMLTKFHEMIHGLNSYLAVLRAANVNAQVTLTSFCSRDICVQHGDARLGDFPTISAEAMAARMQWSTTPLYDAINIAGRNIAALAPQRCHLIVVTDGEATHSATSIEQARAVLDWLRAKGYQVTFIGCDFANAEQARLLGADAGSSVGVAQALLTDAAKALGEKRVRHSRTGQDIHFTKDEQTQFGGYLGA